MCSSSPLPEGAAASLLPLLSLAGVLLLLSGALSPPPQAARDNTMTSASRRVMNFFML